MCEEVTIHLEDEATVAYYPGPGGGPTLFFKDSDNTEPSGIENMTFLERKIAALRLQAAADTMAKPLQIRSRVD